MTAGVSRSFSIYLGTPLLTNDILRKVRYSLDLNDKEMVEIFTATGLSPQDIKLYQLLKKEDETNFQLCSQSLFVAFLDGLIIFHRGSLKKPAVPATEKLGNNDVLRKIRIALKYQESDMLEIFKRGDMEIGRSELSSFFRRKGHKHYQECGDQFLRHFFKGLTPYYQESQSDKK